MGTRARKAPPETSAPTRSSPEVRVIRTNRNLLVNAALLVAVLATVAHAAPDSGSKRILVLESHTDHRPAEMGRFMGPITDELEAHGFVAHVDSLLRLAGNGVGRPGIRDATVSARQVAQDVDTASVLFTNGQYDAAAKLLRTAVDAMNRNPALFALDTSNTDVMYKAQATLALCQRKLSDAAGAVATMTELIRMFPTRPLPRSKYGPADEAFYRDVAKQVAELGRGRLSIAAGDSRAVIFLDGQIRGVGSITLADLIPGIHHAFIQVPQTMGRAFDVVVHANDESTLTVHDEIESALWVTDTWIGFQFATEIERRREGRYASEVARLWSADSSKVAVIGTMQLQGKLALIGTVYDGTGAPLLSAAVAFSEASDTKLRDLARFLADGTPAEGLRVVKAPTATASTTEPPTARRSHRSTLPGIAVFGAGVLTIGVGAYLFATDEDDDGSKSSFHNTAPAGVAVMATGAVVTGIGAILWWRRAHDSGAPVVSIDSSRGFVGWAGQF